MAQRLAQHLISRGLLPAKVVDDALRRLQAGTAALDTILLEAGAVSEAGMLQALSDVSGMRLVNLADFEPNAEAGPMLPLKISRRLNVVPLSVDGNILHLAVGYPVPHKELREVAFLLGKELELWVALECRIKDWQAALYREPMLERFKTLLQDLDPGRRALTPAPRQYPKVSAKKPELILIEDETTDAMMLTEPISREVLEKIAQGVVEEPVLLVKPKVKRPASSAPLELHSTVVLEPKAYAAFAQPQVPKKLELATDEHLETAVLDTTGYANFARQLSKPDAPTKKRLPGDRTPTEPELPVVVLPPPPPVKPGSKPPALPRITAQKSDEAWRSTDKAFPGGVLPPRSRPTEDAPPATNREVRAVERGWMPAPSARPSIERLKTSPSAPRPPPPPASSRPTDVTMPNLKTHNPVLPNPGAKTHERDETDFGDIATEATVLPRVLPVLTAAPLERAGAALPLDPPRPSVPPMAAAIAPLVEPVVDQPPELRPSYGAAPTMASHEPAGPPELAAASMPGVAEQAAEPPPPTFVPRLMSSASAAIVVPSGNPADWTLAQARAALRFTVQDRDKLVSVALDYGRRAFEFVGAFAVGRGAAMGWDARAEGEPPQIRHVSIPLDAASVFRTVALTRGSYVGPLPPDALTQHYLALLGRSPRAVFLWPVEVKGRLVAMLYGDSGGKPVSQRKLNDFILFCQELPSAFGELIVFRKQRLRAPGSSPGLRRLLMPSVGISPGPTALRRMP